MNLLGARVDIHFSKPVYFLGHPHEPYDVLVGWIIDHIPQDSGDSWHFREPNAGFIVIVNPCSANLNAIFFNPVLNQEMIK